MKGRKLFAYPMCLALAAALTVIPAPVMAVTGDITEYPIPTANSQLRGIATGPDGRTWQAAE